MKEGGEHIRSAIWGANKECLGALLNQWGDGGKHALLLFLVRRFVRDIDGGSISPDLARPARKRLHERTIRILQPTLKRSDVLSHPCREVGLDKLTASHRRALRVARHVLGILPLLGLPEDRLVRLRPCVPDGIGCNDPGDKHLSGLCDDHALPRIKESPESDEILQVKGKGLDGLVGVGLVPREHKAQPEQAVPRRSKTSGSGESGIERLQVSWSQSVSLGSQCRKLTLRGKTGELAQ